MTNLNKKILIADDDEIFSMILKDKLINEGFILCVAKNGEEAVELAEKEKPDLILLDIMMPKMTGVEAGKIIREKNSSVIIMFLTAMSDIKYIDESLQSMPSDYIVKADASVQEITDRIKKRLNLKL